MSRMKRAAIKAVKKLTDSRMLYGKLGKAIGSGQYEFEVSGKPGFVYVRIVQGGKQTLAEAINTTVSRIADLPIMLDRSPSGDLYIVGADLRNLSTFQGDSNPNFDASPHSHRIGFGLEDLVEGRRLEPGLVSVGSGMIVQVEPFFYTYNDSKKYFPGGTIDLITNVPGSANQQHWTVVSFNPATTALIATDGTNYSVLTSLSPSLIAEVGDTSTIPLAGIKLRYGQTEISEESLFADARQWFTGGESLISNDDTGYVSTAPATDARNIIQPTLAAVRGLTIRGASSQTDNLLTFEDSTPTILGAFTAAGQLQLAVQGSAGGLLIGGDFELYRSAANIGYSPDKLIVDNLNAGNVAFTAISGGLVGNYLGIGASPSTTQIPVHFNWTATDSAAVRHQILQAILFVTAGVNTSGSYYGAFYDARVSDNVNYTSTGALVGLGAITRHTGSGTITGSRALEANLPVVSGGGVITTAHGLHVLAPSITSGSIGTLYGVRIAALTQAGANYAIETSAGLIYFNIGLDPNSDLRYSGDTITNLLFGDASADTILFGTSTDLSSTVGIIPIATTDIGLVIKGLASQSANLQEWHNSSGFVAGVNASGYFGMGGISPNTDDVLNVFATFTDTGTVHRGIETLVGLNPSGTRTVVTEALNFTSQVNSGNAQNVTGALHGLSGAIIHRGTGTVDLAIAAYLSLSLTAAGTITTGIGLDVVSATNTGGGTLTTNIGLRIQDQTAGGTNYAIQTNAGLVYFNVGQADSDFRYSGDNLVNLIFGDASADKIGFGLNTPQALVHISQATLGNEIFRIESVASNDDPSERVIQNKATTTNATVTTLHTFTIPASTTVTIEAIITARRTGGAAGTAEDGAAYKLIATYKNVTGTATLIGAINTLYSAEDQAGWNCTFTPSAGNVLLEVTGAADNNISWIVTARSYPISS